MPSRTTKTPAKSSAIRTCTSREVANSIRANVSIDWTIKESVRAKLRSAVKRVMRKYGYPPDKQESATDLVIQQAELLCAELAT